MTAVKQGTHYPGPAEDRTMQNALFFCDQTIERHFPSHFWKLYGHTLQNYGIKGTVFAFSTAPLSPTAQDYSERTGVHLFGKPAGNLLRRFLHTIKIPAYALAAVRLPTVRPTVFVVHNDAVLGLSFLTIARLTGRKLIFFSTHLQAETFAMGKGRVQRAIAWSAASVRNWLMRRADCVVSMSDEMARILISTAGVDPERITTINSVVDMARADPTEAGKPYVETLTSRLKAKGCRRWLCYAGSINEARGTDFLASTIAAARESDPSVGLLVLGVAHSASARHRLLDQITSLGCTDGFVWSDPVPEAHLSQCLSEVDVGLSPFDPDSIFRVNSPLKNLDYILGRTPIIASATPENITVVEETGFGRIADYTPEAFAAAALEVIGDPTISDRNTADHAIAWVASNRSFDAAALKWAKILGPEK